MSQFNKTITLLDKNFAVVGDPIKAFESLSYSDAWEDHGALSLVVEKAEYPNIKLASWLMVDGRTYENETVFGSDDALTVKITGAALTVLFDRIVITADERLQGRAEERVRYLVNKYAITGTQAVSGLTLGTDNNYKRAMDITVKRGQTLSEVLFTALPQRGLSFEIVCACDGSGLVFNVLQGLDRTSSQSTNAPVVMSTRAEIEKAEYKRTIMDYRNYAIVCDEQDTPQTVEVDMTNGEPVRAMYVSGKSAGADDSAAPNMYVMVGVGGKIYTSTDGIAWTSRTSGTSSNLWSVTYVNGEFVVGGSDGLVLTSTDGTSWYSHLTGSAYAIEGVVFSDGVYFAFTTSGEVYYSYNKTTWEVAVDGSATAKIVNCVFADGVFVAYSDWNDGVILLTSEDGAVWENTFIPNGSGSIATRALKTSYSYNTIVCVGFKQSSPYIPISIVSTDGGKTNTIYELTDFSGYRLFDGVYGNGVFVAVGQSNIIIYSSDGINWNESTPADSIDYITITFDGTNFLAYGATVRKVAISPDGINWTVQTTPTTSGTIDAVAYGTSSHSGNLYQIGVDALTEAAIVETLDGDVNADLAPVYKVDYNIGDVIDAVDPDHDLVAAKRVLSVEYLVDKTTDLSITPKLGKDALTLRKLIAKEIKNNGI